MPAVLDPAPAPSTSRSGRDPASTPRPRGPLSAALLDGLTGRRPIGPAPDVVAADPEQVLACDDLQLSLYCIHELSYRGFADVDPDLEVHPDVHAWRLVLERAFEGALRTLTLPEVDAWGGEPLGHLDHHSVERGRSLSHELLEAADLGRFREVLVHRSAYQLKEADPHSWALPRTGGAAKAALVEIQMDEYGEGRPGRSHAELFAATMRAAGLDDRYGAHLELLPGSTLATTNLISLLGGRRRLLPALLGHLALFENTSVGPMGRWAALCDRVGLPATARTFYDVHVEADAHHGPLARQRLLGGHLAAHPDDGPEIVFGAAAVGLVEARFSAHLRARWAEGRSSLLGTLPH